MKILRITILALLLLNSCSQRSAILTEKDGFVSIDSTKMYYSIFGSGDTLVVLHGGPGLSHKYLKPQLDSLLSSNFTLLYYDQRGSGWSEGTKDTLKLNMQTFISDLDEIRRHFKLSELNLVGHSFGGLLAMHYGITFPDKLNSLVLIDTDAASYELRTPYQIKTINARLTEEQNIYLDSISESEAYKNFDVSAYDKYYKTFLTSYFANPKDTLHLSMGFDSISIPKIGVTGPSIRRDLGQYDIHDQLDKILCPTLILHGTESVFSVDGAKAINNELANSELHLFEDCGHFEYIEAPNKFKLLIEDFHGIE
ncbi:MAG: alpha/beta fold hydrolase [Flavobacteriaceae bacterium]|nr:alpha/beta fold hydrolase [Bacteroidia bacterium]NND11344.1 alpha/beta fold hydrolase [Flavobacteriaceae bacterium]NNL60872.1 alpha/beta fold hydrolase [Flavobacteriaceae bacterium]RZV67294.1 MAG: alpha/beta fold hydrolase [Flavobacteriaceae bacterium]